MMCTASKMIRLNSLLCCSFLFHADIFPRMDFLCI